MIVPVVADESLPPGTVRLTYNGKVVGEARVVADDLGLRAEAVVTDPDCVRALKLGQADDFTIREG